MFGFKKKKNETNSLNKEKKKNENPLIIKGSVTRCGRPVSPFLRILSNEEIKMLEEKLKKQEELEKKRKEEMEKRKISENWIKI